MLREQALEVAENFLRPSVQARGNHNLHRHIEVSSSLTLKPGESLPSKPEYLTALSAWREDQRHRALKRGHLNASPKDRLGEADRNLAVEVVAFAHEEGM